MAVKQYKTPQSICVMIGDVSFEFSAELMKGFIGAAEKEGVRLVLMMGMPRHAGHFEIGSMTDVGYHYNSIYDYAGLSGADAYVFSCGALSGFEADNTYQEFLKRFAGTPYVILQENIGCTAPHTTCITVDSYSSFLLCMEHLIQVHGYRKIGFVGGLREHPDTRERLRAYRAAMGKYGYPVQDSMIVYGDYSEYSDNQVAWLLDHNPGLEAIAFCNDEMAKGGYRECEKRGLAIGRDIAVTGFDNFSTGRALIPPLTTISQNTCQMGKLAVEQAAALMNGQPVSSTQLDTKLCIRRSCGCNPDTVSPLFLCDRNPEETADLSPVLNGIAADLSGIFSYSESGQFDAIVRQLMEHIGVMAGGDPLQIFDRQAFADWLQSFCDRYAGSIVMLEKRFDDYVMQMPELCLNHARMRKLYIVLSFVRGFLYSYQARLAEQNLDGFREQSWFIPELIRDLVNYDIENESVFFSVVERLHAIHLNNIYICLLPEPRSLHDTNQLYMPNKLLLAAYQSGGRTKAFAHSQMPVIDAGHTLATLPELKGTTHLMSFSIFSGDLQYGVFLCEADISKSPLMHIIGLQLGILINFLDLKKKEKIVGNELENIRERNEILNFLSEYDSQCAILNRRGFIERAIRLNRENVNKHAICVFMDLDHLKEINDTFGHSQGDVALMSVSEMLRQTVRSNDLVARIGGDEFVGMFIVESPAYGDIFKSRLKKTFAEYNESSGLPYYVEASIGIAHFTCHQGLEISKIVNDADRYLYEAKKYKRKSALKEPQNSP